METSPQERKRVMRQVQNLEYQYVVATDLAARGSISKVSLMLLMQKFQKI